jgi:uncharacterized protein with PQ loop repeat
MIKKILCLIFLISTFVTQAQEAPQMADIFRENGKIYIVISVIGIIFISIVLFLIYLERQLKKLEKKVNEDKKNNL